MCLLFRKMVSVFVPRPFIISSCLGQLLNEMFPLFPIVCFYLVCWCAQSQMRHSRTNRHTMCVMYCPSDCGHPFHFKYIGFVSQSNSTQSRSPQSQQISTDMLSISIAIMQSKSIYPCLNKLPQRQQTLNTARFHQPLNTYAIFKTVSIAGRKKTSITISYKQCHSFISVEPERNRGPVEQPQQIVDNSQSILNYENKKSIAVAYKMLLRQPPPIQ